MDQNTLTYEEQLLSLLNEAIDRSALSDKQKEMWWQQFNQFSDEHENRETIITAIMMTLEGIICLEEANKNP